MRRKHLNSRYIRGIKEADTEGMRSNHRTHYKAYLQFCKEYAYKPFPANEWRYCQFSQYLAAKDNKPETIQNYCSTIRTLHRLEGLPVPESGQVHYSKTVESLKKKRTKPVR